MEVQLLEEADCQREEDGADGSANACQRERVLHCEMTIFGEEGEISRDKVRGRNV